MQVTPTGFTVAQYCDQLHSGQIMVNREYQRSESVWPPAARSYLIDTILNGFPIPKFSLYQKTDLRSRKTVYEIVDGQQRSKAIHDFFSNRLRISGPSEYNGMRYSDLDEPEQQKFVSYQISVDLFSASNDEEIRQVFRRINSYTVPLNSEEQRHATHQGEFKWFVVSATETYSSFLKEIGVFTEKNLSRMLDAKLVTELAHAVQHGIVTSQKKILDKFYETNDPEYANANSMTQLLDDVMDRITDWTEIHGTVLMKPYIFFTLFLAVAHKMNTIDALTDDFPVETPGFGDPGITLANLGALAAAAESEEPDQAHKPFVDACARATNTKNQRKVRLTWLLRALDDQLLP